MSGQEAWRPVAGWEWRYEISDHGQLRNVETGRILRERKSLLGYVQYELRGDGIEKPVYAHRLVAAAFLGEPTGPIVRHLDDVKDNNNISDLAYGDHRDNAEDAARNGIMARLEIGGRCGNGHQLTSETLRRYSGQTVCRTCRRETDRQYRLRRAEKALSE